MNYYLVLLRQEIRKLRLALGYSTATMAEKIGVTRMTYLAYEGGRMCPSRKHFYKMLEVARIDPETDEGEYYINLHWCAVQKANERRAISKRKNKNG